MVVVSGFLDPRWKIEVEAEEVVDGEDVPAPHSR
jgi:hypothetical protein